ncbi:unnamed protein product, partial [Brenthis ino]
MARPLLKFLLITTLIVSVQADVGIIFNELQVHKDLEVLLIDILNGLIRNDAVTCLTIVCDDVYLNVFEGALFKRTLNVPYNMIVVEDYEDLLSPNFSTLESLMQARTDGCNVYVILMANGLQLTRLLRFGDSTKNKAWFDLSTVPFPNPIKGIFISRRVDIWKNGKLHYGRDLFADKTRNLYGEILNVVYYDHLPSVVIMKSNNTKVGGVEIEILNTLAQKMKFEPKLYQSPNPDLHKWGGKLSNGSFSGLLGEMVIQVQPNVIYICGGDLRNDNDANCTYEGENSLLLQQTSNWLLSIWPRRHEITAKDSPLGSLEFLENCDEKLKKTCAWKSMEDMIDPYNLTQMYKWLTAFVLKMTYEKVNKLKQEGKNNWEAKNDSQSYNAVTLSVVYGENHILNHFYKTAKSFEDVACRKVLLKLVSLFSAFLLEKHMATLYIGGYFTLDQGLVLREGVLRLCAELVPDAVSLADTLAPPDFCLHSVLGNADGEVYKHIQKRVMTYPGALERPHWWRDVVFWQSYIPSKL